MSVRASASRPSICSGAMYRNVPTIVPCAVMPASVVASVVPRAETTGAFVFASPKSSSYGIGGAEIPPLRTRKMLPGFKSRCTMPA